MKSKVNFIGILFAVCIAGFTFYGFYVADYSLSAPLWLWVLVIFLFPYIRHTKFAKAVLLSPLNIFSEKAETRFLSELDSELMFLKLVQEIELTNRTPLLVSQEELSLMVSEEKCNYSNGENVYFQVFAHGEKSEVFIRSVSMFQVFSWGKNKKNTTDLIEHLEESFTI